METADHKVPSIEEARKNFNEWMKSPELEAIIKAGGDNCKKKGLIRDFHIETEMFNSMNTYALMTKLGNTKLCLLLTETYNSGLIANVYYRDLVLGSKNIFFRDSYSVKRTPEAISEFFKDTLEHYKNIRGYNWSFLPD